MMKELKRNKVVDSNAYIMEKNRIIVKWQQVDKKGTTHLKTENFNLEHSTDSSPFCNLQIRKTWSF